MRFIDMFITAIGGLLFLSILLFVVLHRRSETEDKLIYKRWFSIFILADGCKISDLELYARPETKLVNLFTEDSVPDANLFDPGDAGNLGKKTILFGDQYFDLGLTSELEASRRYRLRFNSDFGLITNHSMKLPAPVVSVQELSRNELAVKLFFGLSRANSASWSVYVGLRELKNPQIRAEKPCSVLPIYLSVDDAVIGQRVILSLKQPFAWLRRFMIRDEGMSTLDVSPSDDVSFKRDLAEFSRKQSKALCEMKQLCDTEDAHYAILKHLITGLPIAR